MAASIELYGMRTGNCIRAAIALEEADIPYLARCYDPRNPGDGKASYLRLNPTGKVPTLVDHGAAGGPFVLSAIKCDLAVCRRESARPTLFRRYPYRSR